MFCPPDSVDPQSCPAGSYASAKSQTDFNCQGLCDPGYYCPEGSVLPDANATACPAGTYNPDQGGQSIDDCLNCTIGYFCPEASVRMEPCTSIDPAFTTDGERAKSALECVTSRNTGRYAPPPPLPSIIIDSSGGTLVAVAVVLVIVALIILGGAGMLVYMHFAKKAVSTVVKAVPVQTAGADVTSTSATVGGDVEMKAEEPVEPETKI